MGCGAQRSLNNPTFIAYLIEIWGVVDEDDEE